MTEREHTPIGKSGKGKAKAEEQQPNNLLQRIKESTKALAKDVSSGTQPISNATINSLQQFTNSKQSPAGSGTVDSTRTLYELEQKDDAGATRPHFVASEIHFNGGHESTFQTWRSEETDGTEILGFLEQQLPAELVPTQLSEREIPTKWIDEFEQASREVENTWHAPEDDGLDVLSLLHSREFPSHLTPDSMENRSDIHEKWYHEFERLFGAQTADALSEEDPLLDEVLNDWEKEFKHETYASHMHSDVDAFRDGPAKDHDMLSSSVESSSSPYTPIDRDYHDPRMDGQEVLDFLNNCLYSDETALDYSDPTNLTSSRQSKYQPLSKPTSRKYASDILEYLVCVPYTDEVYGSYDFSWIDTRSNVDAETSQESVPNQYESALQRLKLLKAHLIPKV
ncbi:hypothetical protein K493DRAFT_35006 [Basidiobolus meristosporus CBS 931.73]|uniref:Uncharacterized protein n=1 Tax=Basidiobolus meristosporus CBS 931.73 TaxID=1314790 RepID=A0A1Y1Y6K9_9FUNG|nr:hypothetical protein K493DRAFT_35006 [Basidiobolus meristosporus CBS 931.73]|eukprot:ORX93661.1 hypothetical protein K493DRAFT_35006 [Basidiobolus meristosporus CBS 931.73]